VARCPELWEQLIVGKSDYGKVPGAVAHLIVEKLLLLKFVKGSSLGYKSNSDDNPCNFDP
jgi:hypothetical protein